VKWWERASFNFTHEHRREKWVFVHGICVYVSVYAQYAQYALCEFAQHVSVFSVSDII
jgi:hypothetical protein